MKIQEASTDLQEGGIMFPSSETSYFMTKTYNNEKPEKLSSGSNIMRLAHVQCT